MGGIIFCELRDVSCELSVASCQLRVVSCELVFTLILRVASWFSIISIQILLFQF